MTLIFIRCAGLALVLEEHPEVSLDVSNLVSARRGLMGLICRRTVSVVTGVHAGDPVR